MNTQISRPLLVRRGASYIEDFCRKVEIAANTQNFLERNPEDEKLLRLLLNHSILIHGDCKEEVMTDLCGIMSPRYSLSDDTISSRSHKPAFEPRSRALYLSVAQGCTLRCVYCVDGRRTTNNPSMMSERDADSALRYGLSTTVNQGELQVVYFGGEPLLNWEVIKLNIEFSQRIRDQEHPEKRISYHVTTSLSFIPDDFIYWARKHNITVLVDIDGPAHLHNSLRPFRSGAPSHEIVCGHVVKLVDAGLRVSLRATITSKNVGSIFEIANHHKDLGGTNTAFVPVVPITTEERVLSPAMFPDADTFVEGLKNVLLSEVFQIEEIFPLSEYEKRLNSKEAHLLPCGAPLLNTTNVLPGGDVYLCSFVAGIPRYKVGNVHENTLTNNGLELSRKLLKELHVDSIDECCKCDWKYMCGGGCPATRLLYRDDMKYSRAAKEYLSMIRCHAFKSTMEMLVWHAAERCDAVMD